MQISDWKNNMTCATLVTEVCTSLTTVHTLSGISFQICVAQSLCVPNPRGEIVKTAVWTACHAITLRNDRLTPLTANTFVGTESNAPLLYCDLQKITRTCCWADGNTELIRSPSELPSSGHFPRHSTREPLGADIEKDRRSRCAAWRGRHAATGSRPVLSANSRQG